MNQSKPLDVTPTFGELGRLASNFLKDGRYDRLEILWPELAKALALAECFVNIEKSLNKVQSHKWRKIYEMELGKQGYFVANGAVAARMNKATEYEAILAMKRKEKKSANSNDNPKSKDRENL